MKQNIIIQYIISRTILLKMFNDFDDSIELFKKIQSGKRS